MEYKITVKRTLIQEQEILVIYSDREKYNLVDACKEACNQARKISEGWKTKEQYYTVVDHRIG